MSKKWFVVLLSLCLLFLCSGTALASEAGTESTVTVDDLLERQTVTYFYQQGSTFPYTVPVYDSSVSILQYNQSYSTFSGTSRYTYDESLGRDVYESFSGTVVETESDGQTYIRFDGTCSFYMYADLPDMFNGTYGSGTLRQSISFGGIEYAFLTGSESGNVTNTVGVINPRARIIDAEMITAIGQTFDGGVLNQGSLTSAGLINYRFNDAGMGVGNEFVKITVAYNFFINADQIGQHPANILNGYARLHLTSSTGYIDCDSAYLDVNDFNNRFSAGLESAMESQNEELMNGYENESGSAVINNGSEVVSSGVQNEEAALDSAGSLAADYDYDSADLTELAAAFSLISGWFMSLISAMGTWNMLIYVSLTMVVALFAIGYFRH